MKDINEVRFSGTVIKQFYRIRPSFIVFTVRCNRAQIEVGAFDALAAKTHLERGDRVYIVGRVQPLHPPVPRAASFDVVAHEIHRHEGTGQQEAAVQAAQAQQFKAKLAGNVV
ncbi:MAG: hypothetical protein ACWGKN_02570 [Desulfoprunum sp.]|jgi:hypothetical protein